MITASLLQQSSGIDNSFLDDKSAGLKIKFDKFTENFLTLISEYCSKSELRQESFEIKKYILNYCQD